jgi:type VI secretion system VgrG family protein
MAIDETKRFTFVSQGLPEDTFSVVEFKGTEGISRLYEFDITLASDDPEIDLKGVLQNSATLTTKGSDQDLPIHGILGQFEQLHEVKGHYFYRALLVPRLWQADLYRENQLFLDKTVPNIIEEILKQAGLTTQDYELKLTNKYPQWEYICQYRETDFDFISRWMEREGIYFFFQQGEDSEKLIITDSSTAHEDIRGDATIPFTPPSGIVPEKEAIFTFLCRQKRLPNKVILKDYNYRKPSLDLKAVAEVDARGLGDVYFYGEHFKTPQEGNGLAKIRAEEIKCRENIYHGESTAPNLCPGFFYELEDHYRQSYNQKYLIVEVEHEGHQTGSFWAGVEKKSAKGEKKLTYTNSFTAIRSEVQFRPERKTPKPKFPGTMNATIDAAGIGDYAELDDLGRYKVKLPFDQSDMEGGKASRWVRMQQPYAGAEHGMHFPLHKGTEVLLTFVDGDPDRPVIAGAVPNPETTSPVTAANQTESVIQTGGKNKIRIQDFLGSERIIMETPAANSWIRVGTPNDPPVKLSKKLEKLIETHNFIKDRDPSKGIKIFTEGNYIEESYGHQKVILDDVRDPAPQFQLSNDTIIEIYDALKALKEKRDNDYNGIQAPAGKTKYEPKKLSDDDIKKIINYLDPNNPYPPKTSNTGQPKTYTDKADFITKTKGTDANYSGSELNNLGISDWGEKQEAIIRIILQYAENDNAWKRTVDIEGEQFYMTDGCHKIEAINGDLKFEMTDGGIVIDSGDKDVTIKCRKFNVLNDLEDNTTFSDDLLYHYGDTEEYTYGTSDSEFHGTATELFYGHKKDEHHGTTEEYFYGNKFCHTGASVEDIHWGHKLEIFGGFQEEISLIHAFAFFLGMKEEITNSLSIGINLSAIFEYNLLKGEKTSIEIGSHDVDVKDGMVKIDGKKLKLEGGFVMLA